MANTISTSTQPAAIPPDDANKKLTMANPDDPKMRHISVAGGTYTILVSGEQTGGRYSLIDMLVPPGGGPPGGTVTILRRCSPFWTAKSS